MELTMVNRGDFERFYAAELQPVLAQTETTRKSVSAFRKTRNTGLIICVAAGLIIFVAGGGAALIVPALAAIALVWIYNSKKSAFAGEFKNIVIGRIIKFINPDAVYEPQSYMPEHEYQASSLYRKKYDNYNGEDFFSGKYDKTAFFCSELHTSYETKDEKGHTHTHTIFDGLFFVADFNKYFNGETYVWQDGFADDSFVGRLFSSFSSSKEQVDLEDPEFEAAFSVYSTDQVEARYILSPSLMQRLLQLKQKMNCPMSCSFVGSKMYMAFETDLDLFEPGISETNETLEAAWGYVLQFRLFFDIIDDLNLNVRIWTKG